MCRRTGKSRRATASGWLWALWPGRFAAKGFIRELSGQEWDPFFEVIRAGAQEPPASLVRVPVSEVPTTTCLPLVLLAPTTFLGWSAAPTTPAIGQLTAADTSCQTSLVQLPPIKKGTAGVSLVPELNDVRGPFTVTVFGDGTQNEALCLPTSNAPPSSNAAIRWFATSGTPPSPGMIVVDQVSYSTRDGQPYTLVVGRIGTGVTGVTLSLTNGDNVTTRSGSGLFVAWWPGSQPITSAVVAMASGTSTRMLNLPGPGNNSTVCLSCDR